MGSAILESVGDVSNHPYRAWIETYADEAFADSVLTARELADRLAERSDADTRRRMFDAFTRATEYEWLFWNSAWQREQWPTAEWRPDPATTES